MLNWKQDLGENGVLTVLELDTMCSRTVEDATFPGNEKHVVDLSAL